jgi:hypothetical protein
MEEEGDDLIRILFWTRKNLDQHQIRNFVVGPKK